MMLFLQFEIGEDAYLLDARQVRCVLPLVDVKTIPRMPRGIAGVFDYGGKPVPVLDLNELALGTGAPRHLSTRLIIVSYSGRLLGLIAQNATDTKRIDPASFAPTGLTSGTAPYLGPVVSDEGRILQWIDVEKLLPRPVSDALFRELGEAA